MILDKINNNTYMFLLIILLIIILFNMSCFMKNKVNNNIIKRVKITNNKNNNINEQFENPQYIKIVDTKESNYYKEYNKDIDEDKKIYSLTLRLKNNNNNDIKALNINSLNLQNGDLIKMSNTKLANSDIYLKINTIKQTYLKPDYSDIEIIEEKKYLDEKKNKITEFITNLNNSVDNYNNLEIAKEAKKNEFILSHYIKIIKNENYTGISDSEYYIDFILDNINKKINMNIINKEDIITIYNGRKEKQYQKNKVYKYIDDDNRQHYILFLDNTSTKINKNKNENYKNEYLLKINYINNILEKYFDANVDNISKLKHNQIQINYIKDYITKLKNNIDL